MAYHLQQPKEIKLVKLILLNKHSTKIICSFLDYLLCSIPKNILHSFLCYMRLSDSRPLKVLLLVRSVYLRPVGECFLDLNDLELHHHCLPMKTLLHLNLMLECVILHKLILLFCLLENQVLKRKGGFSWAFLLVIHRLLNLKYS